MSVLFPPTGSSINIDPSEPTSGATFISHAHTDHTRSITGSSSEIASTVVTSAETKQLITSRFPSAANKVEFHVDFSRLITSHRVNLVPNGHVLGSRSLVISRDASGTGMKAEDVAFLSTGDFSTRPGRLLPPLAVVKAEILACECTFGMPSFEFPPFEVISGEIVDWIATALDIGPVVLYGYPLGKNQELLSLIEPFSADTPIIADEETCSISDVYRSAGIPLPCCEPFKKYSRGKFLENNKRWILLLPPGSRFDERFHKLDRTGCRRALFSGWTLDDRWLDGWRVDAGFPLSDHPSFIDLVEFITTSEPRSVILTHGNGNIVRNHLLERNANGLADHLPRDMRIVALKH